MRPDIKLSSSILRINGMRLRMFFHAKLGRWRKA